MPFVRRCLRIRNPLGYLGLALSRSMCESTLLYFSPNNNKIHAASRLLFMNIRWCVHKHSLLTSTWVLEYNDGTLVWSMISWWYTPRKQPHISTYINAHIKVLEYLTLSCVTKHANGMCIRMDCVNYISTFKWRGLLDNRNPTNQKTFPNQTTESKGVKNL